MRTNSFKGDGKVLGGVCVKPESQEDENSLMPAYMPLTPELTPFRSSATPSETLRRLHAKTAQHTAPRASTDSNTHGSKRARADPDDAAETDYEPPRTKQKQDKTPSKAKKRSDECNDWIHNTAGMLTEEEGGMSVKECENVIDTLGSEYLTPLEKGGLKLAGMKSNLYMYQALGVVWMRQKETGHNKLKGGIFADDMGIGKTVMQLANIVHARLKFKGAREKPTLIVVASGLRDQWKKELDKHCEFGALGSVYIWKGAKAYGGDDAVPLLKTRGLVLTSYSEVLASYREKVEAGEAGKKLGRMHPEAALHRIKFHRVVLDEAAKIKTRDTQISSACRKLDTKFCWPMSGTPVSNSADEWWPYFKLIGVPHCKTYASFRSTFFGADGNTNEAFQTQLAEVMLCRKKETEVLGKKILDLPEKTETEIPVRQNKVEFDLYRAAAHEVKQSVVEALVALENSETTERTNVFAALGKTQSLMVRERQLASHPLLAPHLICTHLNDRDLAQYIRESAEENRPFTNDEVQHMMQLCKAEKARADANDEEMKKHDGRSWKEKAKIMKKLSAPSMDVQTWFLKGGKFLENGKLRMVQSLVKTWLHEDPTVKIVIFTQWLGFIELLGKLCEREGWEHKSYHGKMSAGAKAKTIEQFEKSLTLRLLLATLGTASDGLNLAVASRLIDCDVWWNQGKEKQAIGRIYRHGQTKETTVVRLITEDSVEMRMIGMQIKKQESIDAGMEKVKHNSGSTRLYAKFSEATGYDVDELADGVAGLRNNEDDGSDDQNDGGDGDDVYPDNCFDAGDFKEESMSDAGDEDEDQSDTYHSNSDDNGQEPAPDEESDSFSE